MVKRICKTCGKEFQAKPSTVASGKGNYCSVGCSYKSYITKVNKTCQNCGKEFDIVPSEIVKGGGKYCSKKCMNESHTTKIKRICKTCGKEFSTRQSAINNGIGNYCSYECVHKAKTTKVKRICQKCGKEFWVKPSSIANGKGKFCSNECYGEFKSGGTLSQDHRTKITEATIGGFWYGNVRYHEGPTYCEKWTPELRERVRAFFGYRCVECGTPQNGTKLPVHHVWYNKKLCCDDTPRSLVPLCHSCHSKTSVANKEKRKWWSHHFQNILDTYYDGRCWLSKEEMCLV